MVSFRVKLIKKIPVRPSGQIQLNSSVVPIRGMHDPEFLHGELSQAGKQTV